MAKPDPEVDGWLAGKPAEPALRRVREVILRADSRMTEYLKYGTVQFAFEGDGPSARFMRFADVAEVNQRAAELAKVGAAWCATMAPSRPRPASGSAFYP